MGCRGGDGIVCNCLDADVGCGCVIVVTVIHPHSGCPFFKQRLFVPQPPKALSVGEEQQAGPVIHSTDAATHSPVSFSSLSCALSLSLLSWFSPITGSSVRSFSSVSARQWRQ